MSLFLKKLSLSLCALFFAVLLAEGVHRANEYYFYYHKVRRYQHALNIMTPDKGYVFKMKPNAHRTNKVWPGASKEWTFSLNSTGFRGPEIAAKAPGEKRIVVLGDSYTFGWAVEDDEPYPVPLQEILNAGMPVPVTVVNTGTPGYNTVQEWSLLEEIGDSLQPDVVILGYVVNDAEPQLTVSANPAFVYQDAHLWVWERLKEIINEKIRPRWFPRMTPLIVRKYEYDADFNKGFRPDSKKWKRSKESLRHIRDYCAERKIPFTVYLLTCTATEFGDKYACTAIHNTVRGWCEELSIPVRDMAPDFASLKKADYSVEVDEHPNARAHALYAKLIAEDLRSRGLPNHSGPSN